MSDEMDFNECLIDKIKSTLTHISTEEASDLSNFLQQKGVKKFNDLRHITVNILNERLNFIEASDLYVAWQDAYGLSRQSHEQGTATGPRSSNSSRRPLSTLQEKAKEATQSRLPKFEENSPYFPSGVKTAIRQNKRPSTSDREDMVERVVDYCRESVPNLVRSDLLEVAKQIVRDFGASFKDTIPVSEHGSDSLAKQLQVKFDNDNRKLKRKTTALEKEAPASKEAYGCVMWDPTLPASETEDSLEVKRTDLVKMYRVSRKDWDWRAIKKKLQDSYYLQRKHINITLAPQQRKGNKRRRPTEQETEESTVDDPSLSVPDIKTKWPFLFTAQGMNIHFKILTNVDLKDKISAYVTSEANRMITFLSTKSESLAKLKRKMIRAEEQGLGSTKLVALIYMLICYFKEDINYVVRFTEKTVSYEEMRQFKDLPQEKTPILVAAGDSLYTFERLFVFIDNILVTSVKSILDGLVLLFCAHFVFNICYAEQVACFLTFFQKAIAGMSPTKGSKSQNASTTRKANEKTVKLQNTIEEIKGREKDEENEPL